MSSTVSVSWPFPTLARSLLDFAQALPTISPPRNASQCHDWITKWRSTDLSAIFTEDTQYRNKTGSFQKQVKWHLSTSQSHLAALILLKFKLSSGSMRTTPFVLLISLPSHFHFSLPPSTRALPMVPIQTLTYCWTQGAQRQGTALGSLQIPRAGSSTLHIVSFEHAVAEQRHQTCEHKDNSGMLSHK